MAFAKSPLSRRLPPKWSDEWEKVKAENPRLYHQVVYEDLKQRRTQIYDSTPKFPDFVRSNEEEDVSPTRNGQATSKFVQSRNRTVGGRKYDSNNNISINKTSFSTKPKTWDEETEQWVEVGSYEKIS